MYVSDYQCVIFVFILVFPAGYGLPDFVCMDWQQDGQPSSYLPYM
jgi:hypothetical protein